MFCQTTVFLCWAQQYRIVSQAPSHLNEMSHIMPFYIFLKQNKDVSRSTIVIGTSRAVPDFTHLYVVDYCVYCRFVILLMRTNIMCDYFG